MSAPRWHPFTPRNVAAGLALIVIGLVVKDLFFPMGFRRQSEPTVVVLAPGGNVDAIARELAARGVIRSPFAFALLARIT